MNVTNRESGRAWVYGNDVNTDMLAPGAYMKRPPEELAAHCLEVIDPSFARNVATGDVVVGGRNFGAGSSREQAAQALCQLGVAAVVARSFADIFYRNAINLGLMVLVCPDAGRIRMGDRLSINGELGHIDNNTRAERLGCEPVPAFLLEILHDGGLVPHLEKKLQHQRTQPAHD